MRRVDVTQGSTASFITIQDHLMRVQCCGEIMTSWAYLIQINLFAYHLSGDPSMLLQHAMIAL